MKHLRTTVTRGVAIGGALSVLLAIVVYTDLFSFAGTARAIITQLPTPPPPPVLDRAAYDLKLWQVANATTSTAMPLASTTASTTKKVLWPVKTVYPNVGPILPFNRIVAYYGNFYSTKMGVLGQTPPDDMIPKLQAAGAEWAAADPATPVVLAIDYIAVTAQGSPGKDGMYRFRMPATEIQKAVDLAKRVDGIVILEVQAGLSTLKAELPVLEPFLKLPNVHLALDPEFYMKTGAKPGTVIGTMNAADINYAASFLAKLVQDNNLPPKIMVVHRFTAPMVRNYKDITPLPEVQIIMDMDGWGSPSRKIGTYQAFIYSEPVQFTGFKLFYKNDLKPPSTRLLKPSDVLELKPQPLFIQYQ